MAMLAASAAVACGVAYIAVAGGPSSYIARNVLALVVGVLVAAAVWAAARDRREVLDVLAMAGGVAVVATALFGDPVLGVTRWVDAGPVRLQPALVLVPALAVAWVARPGPPATLGLVAAASGLALAPDRGTAWALAATVIVVGLMDGWDAHRLPGIAAGVAAAVIATVRTDPLGPAPFVEGVYRAAFHHSLVAGLLVTVGALLMLVPGVIVARRDAEIGVALGVCWAALGVASLVGDYPTPLVGYGASTILGVCLCIAVAAASIARRRGPGRFATAAFRG